jgi:hypothetical protein
MDQATKKKNLTENSYDKQHKRFSFQVTHEDMRSFQKMAHGCRNM